MDKSESIKDLAGALAKAQAKIEGAIKDAINPHFGKKYADLGNVVEAIRGPVSSNGLSYVQICHNEQNAACVETIIMHESGEWLSCGCISVPVSKNDAQGFGSALTYARRYSLSAAFGVAPEDDDGNAAASTKPAGGQKKPDDEKSPEPPNQPLKPMLEDVLIHLTTIMALPHLNSWKKKFNADGLWALMTPEEQEKIKSACAEVEGNIKSALNEGGK